MKKTVLFIMISGVAAVSFANTPLLSGSRELKLDFSEATTTIQKMARKFTPMAEKMDESGAAVQEAIAAVKADPNSLNKAKFEKALAQHMKPVMRNIDTVLESELEMQCALEDVSVEVKRVTLRIKQDYERNQKSVDELKESLREKVKDLQKLALEVQAEGDKASREKQMQLKRLQQQVKLEENQLKVRQQVVKQLQAAAKTLSASSDSLMVASDNAQVWFDNLSANRSAFRDLIRSRMEMANIANMGSAGAGKSLKEMIGTFNKAMSQINGVGDLLSDIGGSMDSLEMFQQDASFELASVNGGNTVSVTDLADQILNTDYSYLND